MNQLTPMDFEAKVKSMSWRTIQAIENGANPRVANKGTSSSNQAPPTRTPLTFEERNLLNSVNGCYKCCRPFASHDAKHCPNGVPAVKPTINRAWVENAKANRAGKHNLVAALDTFDDNDKAGGSGSKAFDVDEDVQEADVAALSSASIATGLVTKSGAGADVFSGDSAIEVALLLSASPRPKGSSMDEAGPVVEVDGSAATA